MDQETDKINDLDNWCKAQDNKINYLNGSLYDAEAAIDSIQAGNFDNPPIALY